MTLSIPLKQAYWFEHVKSLPNRSITFFLLFLLYLHESKVNYRKFLEEEFISEVREITLRDFKAGLFANEEN
jgi:hypothetical protein